MSDQASLSIRYFANVRIPSERANAIQIVSMCAAFAGCGARTELILPRRYNRFADANVDIHDFYGVPRNFAVTKRLSIDLIDRVPGTWQEPAFRLQAFTFGLRVLPRFPGGPGEAAYVRDNQALALACAVLPEARRRRLFYEAHTFPEKPRSRHALLRAAKRAGGVVAITEGLADRFREGGLEEDRILVAPDGVDPVRFGSAEPKAVARKRLGLLDDGPIALYAGQFYPWKGADVLVRAAKGLPDWRVVLLGGNDEDRRRLADLARRLDVTERVLLLDRVAPGEVPGYLRAADVLVLPNRAGSDISERYTSPMKLFEYLAAGRPVLASDLPSLREILRDDENALLVPPDDDAALAAGARRLLTEPGLGDRLAEQASLEVHRYAWSVRAERVLAFIRGYSDG